MSVGEEGWGRVGAWEFQLPSSLVSGLRFCFSSSTSGQGRGVMEFLQFLLRLPGQGFSVLLQVLFCLLHSLLMMLE